MGDTEEKVQSTTTASSSTSRKFDKDSVKARLWDLQMKKNEARVKVKDAADIEKTQEKEGPSLRRKREREEEDQKQKEFEEKLKSDGVDPERYYMLHTTLEKQDEVEKSNKNKKKNIRDPHSEDAQFRSFKRRRQAAAFSEEEYERQKTELGDDFYNPQTAALNYGKKGFETAPRVEAMVRELKDQEDRRKKFSRRRTWNEETDISFINESNRRFNIKAARAYDKYTTELRENLERGTAL